MQVLQTTTFRKAVKKLHANQKRDLDEAVNVIMAAPHVGGAKVGELAGVRVYKFKMAKHLALLAYIYEGSSLTLTLLAIGMHENFYRSLKKSIQ